ncbi:MAG: hypothetical protein ACD_30C00041G0008 [uncultured bacterium]|uniref:Uncharacterized protein n=1 Tax=Candidatus Daviesbacteria bacterium GW2011_GWB1_36_5 TaxID=1618426 RepID=A0A0G0HYX6_9BACT|nr:MAG: hypothetical protein ACD_30C00041G0008 [uncultured bacterium]KKQ09076.1 MAG: hypothetical protein US19_C0017G0021 [Candidatus Daviesbacteria bacterium GW2011_GWB1_36_5]OGE32163.1 MAG: hypothetical protein A3C99_02735 [Candidatus Daviesbacteria bacterium RIFCSPHIGHO2_02_FULL_37_9]
MKKFRISKEFRARFSEKLMDLGNLAGAALIFGQFISGHEFSVSHFLAGLLVMALCYIMSYIVNP